MSGFTDPQIYVGTYRKYNEGDLHGAWLKLEDYSGIDDFWEAVDELHAAEIAEHGEIEPMFQDWEGIPDRFISESHLSSDVFDEWVDLDEDDRELLEVYLEDIDRSGTLQQAKEAFQGKFRSEGEWAEQYIDDVYDLSKFPLANCIDYEAFARDASFGDMNFVNHEGEVWAFSRV